MKTRNLSIIGVAVAAAAVWTTAVDAANRPKLVVAIVVDQFRCDYLTRFRSDYHAGFERLLTKGAVFTDAGYVHANTVTANGHSTVLTGALPSVSGIVGDSWWDRTLGRSVESVADPEVKTVGQPPPAPVPGPRAASGATGASGALPVLSSSPRHLLVSTVGDELKMRYPSSHVVGVSIKPRGAILPSGRMADGAYWFEDNIKRWVTSTYYRKELPQWVTDLNAEIAKRDLPKEWYPLGAAPGSVKPYCVLKPVPPPAGPAAAAGPRDCTNIDSMPAGNELIEEMAERAAAAENLGGHETTDILTVSFSANDYVGHAVGPDAPEVRDISIRTDILIGKLMDYLESRVGAGNVTYVLTADHGVAPVPEVNQARNMPGGRLTTKSLADKATAALSQKFGPGEWLISGTEYLNLKLIAERNLDRSQVERVAADAMKSEPHIARVYTRTELESGAVTGDPVGRAFTVDFYGPRSGELFVLQDPYWIFRATSGTTHGTPYWYDAHVPIIFLGAGIKQGVYGESIAVNDIAPTISTLLGVEIPSGNSGNVLRQIIDDGPAPAPVPATETGRKPAARGASGKR